MSKTTLALMASKGGVGKSTLAKAIYTSLTLNDIEVNGIDGDPQQHFAEFLKPFGKYKNPEVLIFDTQGAWTTDNQELLEMIKAEDDAKIIIPFLPSDDDVKEALIMFDRLASVGVEHKSIFVINCTYRDFDPKAKGYCEQLKERGLNVCKWQIQRLNDIAHHNMKGKAKSQIIRFLSEVI